MQRSVGGSIQRCDQEPRSHGVSYSLQIIEHVCHMHRPGLPSSPHRWAGREMRRRALVVVEADVCAIECVRPSPVLADAKESAGPTCVVYRSRSRVPDE